MINKSPGLIVEIANSHSGNYKLLKKTIDSFFEIKYKNKSIKLQIFKYDKIADKSFSYYKIYKKLFFEENKWIKLIDYIHNKKEKIYLDIYDDYGIAILKKKINCITGIKIQFSSVIDTNLITKLKFIQKKNIDIIVNITTFSKREIKNIFDAYSKLSKNVILQFGHQSYPTTFNKSGFNKVIYLKKNYPKISFAEHFDYNSDLSKYFIQLSRFYKIDIIEKHFIFDRNISIYDYQSALNLIEFNNSINEAEKNIINLDKTKFFKKLDKNSNKFYFRGENKLRESFLGQFYLKKDKKDKILSEKDFIFRRTNKPFLLKKRIDFKSNLYFKKKNTKSLKDIKKLKIGAIIIARSNSSRLKGKIFKKIGNKEMLSLCIENAKKISFLDTIIVATTSTKNDKKISKITKKNNVKIFYGNGNNVLKRYDDAAKKYKLDVIVRITGDCPFISSEVMNLLLWSHLQKNADFTLPSKATLGTAGEIINYNSLSVVNKEAINKKFQMKYREYFKFFFQNPRFNFKYNEVILPKKLVTKFRLTVDYNSDLLMFRKVFNVLKTKKKEFELSNILKILREKKLISKINSNNPVIYNEKEFIQNINKEISK